MPMVYCRGCGKEIHDSAITCPACGAVQKVVSGSASVPVSASDRRILPAFLLCFFLGCFGAHRFYAGKIGTAIVQIVTFGGLGVWMLIDLILILTGSFTDEAGNRITLWT